MVISWSWFIFNSAQSGGPPKSIYNVLLFLNLLVGRVVHEGHVVCGELLRVVGLRDGGQDAHDERDRRRLGRVVEGLPDGDLQ